MNRNKTAALFLSAGLSLCLAGCIPGPLMYWLYSGQYNANGISHFLVVTIDREREPEYIGRLEDHDVYTEQMKVEETCFRSVDARNVPMEEAFQKGLVSIEDWREHARLVIRDQDWEILVFENYEIAISGDQCIIRPRQ